MDVDGTAGVEEGMLLPAYELRSVFGATVRGFTESVTILPAGSKSWNARLMTFAPFTGTVPAEIEKALPP